MQVKCFSFVRVCIGLAAGFALAGCAFLWAQSLPMEPAHESGQSITGSFEGWFSNPDGTYSILVGYYNRNAKQVIDIPPGPNNRIEPGGPDMGQPTHFLAGRQWGVFTIVVPKNFGEKRLTWTIVANGKTTAIPLDIGTLWEVSPFVDASMDKPAFISFAETGPFVNGPKGQTISLTDTIPNPLPLTVWVTHAANTGPAAPAGRGGRGPSVTVGWSMFRGPGSVTFEKERPQVEKAEFKGPEGSAFTGKASTTATFSDPGEYILKVVANDSTGDGGRGFQCCWSNAYVKVSVKGGSTGPGAR
jgi:hypothetical protein